MEDWAKNLEIKSKVIIRSSGTFKNSYVTAIKRITKTLFITESDARFNRKSLHSPGGNCFNHTTLEKYTKEKAKVVLEANRKKSLIWKIGKVKWDRLSLPLLEKVYELIEK